VSSSDAGIAARIWDTDKTPSQLDVGMYLDGNNVEAVCHKPE
jgi:hypothetical protein